MDFSERTKGQAAYQLGDEIYRITRDSQLAHLMINDIFEHRLDEDDLGATNEFRIRRSYADVSWRLEILLDFVCRIKEQLERLDQLGRAYNPEISVSSGEVSAVGGGASADADHATVAAVDLLLAMPPEKRPAALAAVQSVADDTEAPSPSTEDLLLGLLTNAAKHGQVSSKELGKLLQSASAPTTSAME